ncbi:MAG: hypothetical protein ACYSWP_13055 [Planctomycetota bacterium]
MKGRIFLFLLVLLFGFLQCGYCTVLADVYWHMSDEPPSSNWITWPYEATSEDIINFSGPSILAGSPCIAEEFYGGVPTLAIDHINKTIELLFEPPVSEICFTVVVCGLFGQFGPLGEGEWLFFSDAGGDIRFHIEFTVSPPPIIEMEYPNGGESFVAGSSHVVHWRDLRFEDVCPSTYVLEYSIDNGSNWITDVTIPGRCSALWTVPDVNSDECLVSVYDTSEPDKGDQSDQTFTIYQCTESFAADYNVDCYVNGYDYSLFAWWWGFEMAAMSELAEMASTWLECSNPYDPDCGD